MTAVYTDELMAACDCAAGRILQQEDVRAADVEWATTSLPLLRHFRDLARAARDQITNDEGCYADLAGEVESLEIAIALRVERLGRFAALA